MSTNAEDTIPTMLRTASEARAQLRVSKSHLSKIVNGKVKNLPRLPAVYIGRRQLFRQATLDDWIARVEENPCKKDR